MPARHLQIAKSEGAKAGFNFWRAQLQKFGHELPEGNKKAQFNWYCANKLNGVESEPKGIQVVETARRITRRRRTNGLSVGDTVAYETKDGEERLYEITGEGKSKYNKPAFELTNVETGRAKMWSKATIEIYRKSGRIERI